MGRYYTGDINGKFWLGVQSSTDADFFGVEAEEPRYAQYCIGMEDMEGVVEGIAKCREHLGDDEKRLTDFFETCLGYNDADIVNIGVAPSQLEWFARLKLGTEILNSLETIGQCEFEAEL